MSAVVTLASNPMRTLLELAQQDTKLSDTDRRFALSLFEESASHANDVYTKKQSASEEYKGEGWLLYFILKKMVTYQHPGTELQDLSDTTRNALCDRVAQMIEDKDSAGELTHRIGEHALFGRAQVPLHLKVHAIAMYIHESAKTGSVMRVINFAIEQQDGFLGENHIREYPGTLHNKYPWKLLEPPHKHEQSHAIRTPISRVAHYSPVAYTSQIIKNANILLRVLTNCINEHELDKSWKDLDTRLKNRVYTLIAENSWNKDIAGENAYRIGELAFLKQGYTIPATFRIYALATTLFEYISEQSGCKQHLFSIEYSLEAIEARAGSYTPLKEKGTLSFKLEEWEKYAPLTVC